MNYGVTLVVTKGVKKGVKLKLIVSLHLVIPSLDWSERTKHPINKLQHLRFHLLCIEYCTPGFEIAQTLEAASIDLTAFFLPFSIIGSPKNFPRNRRKRDFHINRQFCMYIIGEAQLANFTYLFTLDGNSFVMENLNIINQMTVGKNFSGAAK